MPGYGLTETVVPAVVTNITPAENSNITKLTPIQIDVTHAEGVDRIANIAISVLFPATGQKDDAYDGEEFSPFYVAQSTRTAIADGYRFRLLKSGGWDSSPQIRVRAIDTSKRVSV